MEDNAATVYLVDDDDGVRYTLTRLLSSIGLTIKAFSSAADFLAGFEGDTVGCLIVDVRMPEMSGIALQAELNDRDIDLPVIFLTGHADVSMSVRAMKAGAFDFLEKPFNDQDLLDAVQRGIGRSLDRHAELPTDLDSSSRVGRLTQRQKQVLELIVAGEPNKQIGYKLGITEKTVEYHRHKVMQKMEAKSLADLFKVARGAGLG